MIHTKCKIIGITGGIATGKSTFTEILKSLGYGVIDADKIARDLMRRDSVSYKKTVEYFGDDILEDNGDIDRRALGEIVFSNSKELEALNSITHPFIFEEMKEQIKSNSDEIIFLDIPLLFEEYDEISSSGIVFDEVWLVFADREAQIDRIIKRDSLTKKEAISRINSQMPIDLKKGKADRVIYNLGSIDKLKTKIELLLKDLS